MQEEQFFSTIYFVLCNLILSTQSLGYYNFPMLKNYDCSGINNRAVFRNANKYFKIASGNMRKCAYCRKTYDINFPYQECMYHNIPKPNSYGVYRCCNTRNFACKQREFHCTNDINLDIEGVGYILSSQCRNLEQTVLVIDCEFSHTTRGSELSGFAIIDWDENIIADVLMQPDNVLRERSGRSGRWLTQEAYRTLLTQILGPNVILVGHALNNDLLKMKIISDKIIDTSVLYIEEGTDPARKISLDSLVSKHLRYETYGQHILTCSKSLLDAAQTLRLVKKYINKRQ